MRDWYGDCVVPCGAAGVPRWRFSVSARTRCANGEAVAVGHRDGLVTSIFDENWWSRGESNPRPQAILRRFYMRSSLIWFLRR